MQKSTPVQKILFSTISLLIVVSMYAFPTAVHAQVIDPVTSCTAPTVGDFTPYVYDNQLDSFDFYVTNQPGTAYLPLAVVINNAPVDLLYVSVWHNVGDNRVKIHVDVPDENLGGNITISVSLLQETQGPPPLCPTGATFHVNLPTTGISNPNPSTPLPSSGGNPSTPTTPTQGGGVSTNPSEGKPVTSPSTGTTSSTTTGPVAGSGQCTTLPGWLLIVLLLLDIVISAMLLLFMSVIVRTNARLILAVLLPPLVFIALWYFLDSCHTSVWFPILAVILGIVVLTGSGSPETFEMWRKKISNYYTTWYKKLTTKKVTTITLRDNKTTVIGKTEKIEEKK